MVEEIISLWAIVLLSIVILCYWKLKDHITYKFKKIMASQAELAQQLRDLKAQAEKVRQENLTKFAALEEALANAGNTTSEVDAAMSDLKTSLQAADDDNPDA